MIADHFLNLVAFVVLRTSRPLTARAIVQRVGRLFPQRSSPEELRKAAAGLGSRGTCLSRALAIAARAQNAEVVLGVRSGTDSPFLAHAWVEVGGCPLHASDPAGHEITRLSFERLNGSANRRI